jgi:hypothetical protein
MKILGIGPIVVGSIDGAVTASLPSYLNVQAMDFHRTSIPFRDLIMSSDF